MRVCDIIPQFSTCSSRSEMSPGPAAAGLRISTAHARWEQIQLGDVNPVIEFTRELMAAHLE